VCVCVCVWILIERVVREGVGMADGGGEWVVLVWWFYGEERLYSTIAYIKEPYNFFGSIEKHFVISFGQRVGRRCLTWLWEIYVLGYWNVMH
jgi:hypothetical protein